MSVLPDQPSDGAAPGHLVAGRYRLAGAVGRGAMGTVWRARDERLRREVALKQVFSQVGLADGEAADRRSAVLREGRAAARFRHPHAVAVHDVAVDSGQAWLVMDYFPSRSLGAQLVRRGPLAARDAARIGAEVADALAAAHDAGVVHSDVKPGNILVAEGPAGGAANAAGSRVPRRGEVRLTDFGIARMLSEAAGPADDDIVGTPVYFSPEVARGLDPTPASDVFSLGATLWTLVEGEPPFGGGDTTDLLRRIAAAQVEPPAHGGAMAPVVVDMMAPDPARRPTMAQASGRLAAAATGLLLASPDRSRPDSPRPAPPTVPRPVCDEAVELPVWRRAAPAVVAVTVLVLLAVLVLVALASL